MDGGESKRLERYAEARSRPLITEGGRFHGFWGAQGMTLQL